MDTKLSSKELLHDISAMRKFAMQLLQKGKAYENLLKLIIDKDYYYSENISFPSIKELQAELGISYPVIRNQLARIYDDLLDYEENGIDFSINEVEYIFTLRYFDNYASFKLDHLPVMPRVGEEINIPFLKAKVGTRSYYVDRIDYYLDDTKQTINISLRSGMYNHYWKLKKDEALLTGKISFDDYFAPMDYDLKEKLGYPKWFI